MGWPFGVVCFGFVARAQYYRRVGWIRDSNFQLISVNVYLRGGGGYVFFNAFVPGLVLIRGLMLCLSPWGNVVPLRVCFRVYEAGAFIGVICRFVCLRVK